MKINCLLFTLLTFAFAGALQAQQGFSTIEERMTGKEFTTSGLDKLSAEELMALNEWLRSHSVATLSSRNEEYSESRGFENEMAADFDDRDVIARVKGPFTGWSGKTVFELDNGMVWEQVEMSTFYIPQTENAVVIIEKGIMGSWRLKAEGYNKTVRVNRLK